MPCDHPSSPDFWFITLRELEEGMFPDTKVIALNLRISECVPERVRKWLAEYVDGKIVPPRGARKRSNWYETGAIRTWVRAMYEFHRERIVEDRKAEAAWRKKGLHDGEKPLGTPSEEALLRTRDELAREGYAMSEEAIRDVLRGRGRWK